MIFIFVFGIHLFYCNLENLEKARKIADIAKYKSDFSLTGDETIAVVNIPNSPSPSTSSMPLFSSFGIKRKKYLFRLLLIPTNFYTVN